MEEYDAIRRLKRGDIGGLETLVRLHQLRAARAAYLIVRDAALAEDVAQEAFLRAYGRIGQFDASRPFGPWFYRLVVNMAQRAAARAGRQAPFDSPVPGGELTLADVLADRAPGPEALAEQAELRDRLWQAMRRLAPAQRAAVVQRYYLGLSEAEIAAGQASSLKLHLSLTAAEYALPSDATPVVVGNSAQAQPAILLATAGPFEFDFEVPIVGAN